MKYIVALLAAVTAQAQYFPLHVGNQWIYRLDEGPVRDLRIAEVLRSEMVDDKEYFVYRGLFGRQSRIRMTADNKLVQWNPDGTESLWTDFAALEGATYPISFDDCTGRARVESRDRNVELLGRAWEGGFAVSYGAANCADAGVQADLFLPGLGLAGRTHQSFTGPRTYRLTYARIGGAAIPAGGEYSFRLNLAQHTYATRAIFNLRLTLENFTKDPITLIFPSSQSYDFSIRDAQGNAVYTWSANKLFAQQYREVIVTGEMNWVVSEELDLRPGEYVLEAWLATQGKPVYKAQLPIAVAAIEPAN